MCYRWESDLPLAAGLVIFKHHQKPNDGQHIYSHNWLIFILPSVSMSVYLNVQQCFLFRIIVLHVKTLL